MRPFIFHPNVLVPDAPATVAVSGGNVTWVDTTPAGGVDAQGIPTSGTNAAYPEPTSSPKNEIGYKIYVNVALDANGYVPAAAVPAATVPANVTSVTAPAGATTDNTVVVAYNAAGNSKAGTNPTAFTPGANGAVVPPATTPGTIALTGATVAGNTVTVASTAGLVVGASVSGGGFPQGTTITAIIDATHFTTSVAGTSGTVNLTVSQLAAAALPSQAAWAAPTGLTQVTNADGSVTLAWTAVPGATSYTVTTTEMTTVVAPAQPTVLSTATATIGIVSPATVPATTYTTPTTPGLNIGSTYSFAVTATTLSGTTAAATVVGGLTNSKTLPPVAFTGAAGATGSITLQWANDAQNKNNVAGLQLTWTPNGGTAVSKTFAPTTTGATLIGLTSSTKYSFTLQAISNVAAFNSTVVSLPAEIAAP
jgi:hypothetical protein